MRASIWAHLLLVSSAAAQTSSSPSISTITPAPSLLQSGVPAALIGSQYISQLGGSTTWYCPVNQIWKTEGRYAACCTNDPYQECAIAVSCESTSLLVGPGGSFTITCSGTSSQTVCITGLVYESTSGTAAVTNVGCWPTWDAGFWVATKTASTSTTTASSTLVPPATTDNLPSPLPNPIPIGAIIGAAIGGLALLLIFLGACLWFTCSSRRQETWRKWSFNSVRRGRGSDQIGETWTPEDERRATLAPEVTKELGDTSVVRKAEMPAEAPEVTAGKTAAAQTMELGAGDDAASAASFRTADAHHVDD